ncbi:EpsG family protein [Acinetobacter ursingii]|uniref:EpsG family protein n=5 Tax=Moraxellaceae TaxID=468 RepID=UPI000F68F472|nr:MULTISPECIES: EpsG family protein [Acinetobacter]MCU4413392.1 EpsG family protein [Acinetobacter sp. WU_MDCI_Axc73]MDG9949230.1 EpsG family protein [Acinetobacter ursingii]RSC22467.1 EpsG family protein [Acinetobacter sp. FDAARGOS_515]UYF78946.1 EpsG family protein [Acinetobacter ursingii]VTX53493.1 Uncharacterised protein [Acinetobacter ursingii]
MKKHNVLNLSLSFINPVLGGLFSLKDLLIGRDASLTFSFCIALISVYLPVMWDTSVNFFSAYYGTYSGGLNDWLNPYVSIPSYFMFHYGIDFYFFIFLYVFFISYVWTKVVFYSTLELDVKYKFFIIFSVLFFSFTYYDFLLLTRSMLATSVFFYYIFFVKNKSLLKGFIFFALSIYIHFFIFLFLILFLLSKFDINVKIIKVLLLFSLVVGFFLPQIIHLFSGLITGIPLVGNSIYYYIFSDTYGVQSFSLGELIKRLFVLFFVFITSFFASSYAKENSRLLVYLGCFCLIFSGFFTFFERTFLAFSFLCPCIFAFQVPKNVKYLISFMIFVRGSMSYIPLLFFAYFVSVNGIDNVIPDKGLRNKIAAKPLYYSTPLLLDIHNNGYSDFVLLNHSVAKVAPITELND